MMLSQRLRHRVAIQERIETTDSATGARSYAWQTITVDSVLMSSVPAEVLTGPGREFGSANTKQAQAAARITIRWFAGLSEGMRIVWQSKNYDITSIEYDVSARRECRLICAAGVNDGA